MKDWKKGEHTRGVDSSYSDRSSEKEGSSINKEKNHSEKPIGNFVKSFTEPTIKEKGQIVLSNQFPYKPLKNVKLQTTIHMIESMDHQNVSMEYVSFILNKKNQGFRSKDQTIVVNRPLKNQNFSYVVLNDSNGLVTIVKNTATLPKYINQSRRLW